MRPERARPGHYTRGEALMSRIPAERILAALDLSGLSTKRYSDRSWPYWPAAGEVEIMDWAELPAKTNR